MHYCTDATESDIENVDDDLDYNILINARQLKNLIETNFICKHCCTQKRKRNPIVVSFNNFGIATEIRCFCKP